MIQTPVLLLLNLEVNARLVLAAVNLAASNVRLTRLPIVSIKLLRQLNLHHSVCLSLIFLSPFFSYLFILVLRKRFANSLALRSSLESAANGLRIQQELVQDLHNSFLESIARLKVTGEDPVLLVANISKSDPNFVLDYDTFYLLATFFGWDSPMNLSSSGSLPLSKWFPASSSDSTTGCAPATTTSMGLPDDHRRLAEQLFGSSSSDAESVSSPKVHSPGALDGDADPDPDPDDQSGVPVPADFNEALVFGVESQIHESRMSFFPSVLSFYLTPFF